jgi:hypothetical protein
MPVYDEFVRNNVRENKQKYKYIRKALERMVSGKKYENDGVV